MTLGKLKCTTIEDDASNSITVADLVTLDSGKAPKASPTFTGTVTMPATTALAGQASDITIVDNNAAALEVKEGSTAYVTFDTTNSSEQIEVAKKVQLAEDLEFSGAKDIKIVDSNASAFNVAEGSNNYVTFDTTDEQVEVNKKVTLDGDLQFMVASDILMTDDSATALEVKEGSTSYMTFDTTNSAEQVEVNVPLVLNSTTELRLADTDSSNYIALKSAGTVSSNQTWTLPNDDPAANDVLTVSSISGTNPTLAWTAPAGGLFDAYAIIVDQPSNGTEGGSVSANTVHIRNLTAEIDPDNFVTLDAANNRFTLGAGSYYIRAAVPGHRCQEYIAYLWNQTTAAYAITGQSAYSYLSTGSTTNSLISGRITLSGNNVFDVRMIVNNAYGTQGQGRATDAMSNYTGSELYTFVEIFREAS